MKKIITALLFTIINLSLQAGELTVSGKNIMKYGNGSEWAGPGKDIEIKKEFWENQLDLDFAKDEFQFGLRIEATSPSEYGENIKDITKKYVTYQKDNYTLTGGDFYTIFGRGLVLDLRESKAEFFDNKITGGYFNAEKDFGSIKLLGGKSYYKYYYDKNALNATVEEMPVNVYGGNAVLNLANIFKNDNFTLETGFSYLKMRGDSIETNDFYQDIFIKESETGAFSISSAWEGLEFYSEYAVKTVQRDPSVTGWAGYLSLGYAAKGIGITLEGKDYYRYSTNPNHLKSGLTPFQNPPEVIINHRSHLLSAVKHNVNPNDELGLLLQAQFAPVEGLETAIKAAMSSRRDEDKIMIQQDKRFLPYQDVWAEASYALNGWKLLGGGGYFLDCPLSKSGNASLYLNKETENDKTFFDERITGMAEAGYKINEESDAKATFEFQQVKEGTEILSNDFNEYYLSAEYNIPAYGYLSVGMTKTTQEVSGDAPDTWLNFEGAYQISANHKLEIFYGRERAGIKCTGGACRQVPEFEGIRATLVSTF